VERQPRRRGNALRHLAAGGRRFPAMPVALLALFLSLFGSATAAKVLIDGKNIKNGSIPVTKLTKKAHRQLTAHARTADTAAISAASVVSASVFDGVAKKPVPLSSTPAPGALLPLDANGSFPESVLPLNSTTKAPNIAARVYNSTDEPIGGSVTLLTFDRVQVDTAHLFDPTHPTALTAPVSGIYLINANVSWQITPSPTGLNRAVYVYVNGGAVSVDQRPPAEETRQVVTTIYPLKAGDQVTVGVAHDAGMTLNANGVGAYAPSLAMAWIAPG
jgi:hypothetical protein